MPPSVTATLRSALRQLEMERKGIDRQIAAIRAVLGDSRGRRSPAAPLAPPRAKAKRPRTSAAARRAVSQRMKAYWAKRKAEKTKGKA